MTEDDFRAVVAAELETWRAANAPTTDFIYENGPVPEENAISSPWVDVSIRWYGGTELTIGEAGTGRHSGALVLSIYSREGSGTAGVVPLLAALRQLFGRRRMGSAVIKFPQVRTPTKSYGWYCTGLLFPFTLDV